MSRRTAYRHFPTQEQLLIESALERLRPTVEAALELTWVHEPLLRTMARLTAGGATSPGVRPRGARRIDWLTAAVHPVRAQLGARRFERLVSALCVCVGFDALFVLRDVRGLAPPEALRVSRWMAEAMLRASLPGAAV